MNEIKFSTDPELLDMELILHFLKEHSYWANTRDEKVIRTSFAHSICVGMYRRGDQIGFARIVTDHATMYYIADVFILPRLQNQGLGHQLMEYVESMPEIKGLRGILTTQTAHKFYEEFGYSQHNDVVQKRMMVKERVSS